MKTFEVLCPCCGARLTLDSKLGAVVAHEPPPEKTAHLEMDLGQAAKKLKDIEAGRDDLFRQSIEAQKKHGQLLDRKFEEAFKKVKDQPVEKPLRDFDLD